MAGEATSESGEDVLAVEVALRRAPDTKPIILGAPLNAAGLAVRYV